MWYAYLLYKDFLVDKKFSLTTYTPTRLVSCFLFSYLKFDESLDRIIFNCCHNECQCASAQFQLIFLLCSTKSCVACMAVTNRSLHPLAPRKGRIFSGTSQHSWRIKILQLILKWTQAPMYGIATVLCIVALSIINFYFLVLQYNYIVLLNETCLVC